MTIVLAVVTPESLILASDSATTQSLTDGIGPPRAVNFWNSANKIVNLPKAWPLGIATFGAATLDGRSVAAHAKDLRCILSGQVSDPDIAALQEDCYSVEQLAVAVATHFDRLQVAQAPPVPLGFMVGGYSHQAVSPEVWQVLIGEDEEPRVTCEAQTGEHLILHQGMTDAVSRVVDGVGQALPQALTRLGLDPRSVGPVVEDLKAALTVPLVWPGMPLGESIDLARFLVDTTIKFVRFVPGDACVGGPIEVAAITRHEGFKWVQRKHYFSPELNPQEATA